MDSPNINPKAIYEPAIARHAAVHLLGEKPSLIDNLLSSLCQYTPKDSNTLHQPDDLQREILIDVFFGNAFISNYERGVSDKHEYLTHRLTILQP